MPSLPFLRPPPWLTAASTLIIATACSSGDPTTSVGVVAPPSLLDLDLSNVETRRAVLPRLSPSDSRSPSDITSQTEMLSEGYGQWAMIEGETHLTLTPNGDPAPAEAAAPRLLVRFAHVADLQLTDDESPSRVVSVDLPFLLDGAYRPQDAYLCHLTNAIVTTLNRAHAMLPLNFVLLGGDNADNAQENEHQWLMSLLNGTPEMHCDSGSDDDPVPGPGNDPKDSFSAVGLDVPWLWVTGNHDILVQGNFVPTSADQSVSIGTLAENGTRDWSQPRGPVIEGDVAADPLRRFLSPQEMLTRLANDQAGHGLNASQATSGKATYRYDVEDTNLSFVVIDTASATGGAEGLIQESELPGIAALLDETRADGKTVVLASHHAASALGVGTMTSEGVAAPVLEDDWLEFLSNYPHVVFSMVGHGHVNRAQHLGPADGGFWEIMTAAVADYPHQARLLEIWAHDNSWLMLRATSVDVDVQDNALAQEGLELGVMDHVAGWSIDGLGEATARNVELWIPRPE
ncbi:MAG: metallophosphoesterase [Polyangiaceae bacterium]|nr:metallophosphoesterase [Polyangiaceae bacterium]